MFGLKSVSTQKTLLRGLHGMCNRANRDREHSSLLVRMLNPPQQKTIHSHTVIYNSNYMTAIKNTANEPFWEPQARCGVSGVLNKA